MIGEIIQATAAHARSMAPHLRTDEVREILASHGLDPLRHILMELERSIVAWSWVVDGEVACMFGIVQPWMIGKSSYPWFLSTGLVNLNAYHFARACKKLLPELLSRHPHLVGMVDARYHLSIRWLKWLGATVYQAEPYGLAQEDFCRFEIGE